MRKRNKIMIVVSALGAGSLVLGSPLMAAGKAKKTAPPVESSQATPVSEASHSPKNPAENWSRPLSEVINKLSLRRGSWRMRLRSLVSPARIRRRSFFWPYPRP